MGNLKSAAEDFLRRQRIDAHYHDGEAAIPVEGDFVYVSEDTDSDRLVFWAKVVGQLRERQLLAAQASLGFNEYVGANRDVTLGVSPTGDCAILGRSIEIDGLDSTRLLAEARDFHLNFLVAKSFLTKALGEGASPGAATVTRPTENFDQYKI